MSEIKAIIWDWGGVCCAAGEHFSNKRMLEQAGMTPEEMSNASKEIESEFYKGKITEKEFWNKITAKFNLKGISLDQLRKSYFASSEPYNDIFAAIKKLKSNYKSALLSNLAIDMSARIKDIYNINELFETIIFSHEVGMMKPDEAIYRLMLEKLRLRPQECVFIDDSKKNIDAANKLGIKTVFFQNPSQAIQDLKKLGIEV